MAKLASCNINLLFNWKIEVVEEQQKIMHLTVKLAAIRPNLFWDFYVPADFTVVPNIRDFV